MKKILTLITTLLLMLCSISNVLAEGSVPNVDNTPRVVDYANIFDSEQVSELNESLTNLSEKHNADFVIVTTNDACGLISQDYADDFYDYNGYADNGILLLYDFDNRNIYVSTKGTCINNLSDYGREEILDYIWSDIEYSDYYAAATKYIEKIDEYISYAEQGYIIDINSPAPSVFGTNNIIIAFVISAIITLITVLVLKKQLKSVATQRYAGNYIKNGSFILKGHADFFVGSHVSKQKIEKDHGGGGSSSHSSSSGSSHGGGGRSF